MPSSWYVRLALATCALLLTATALLWMESEGEAHRSSSMLKTVHADEATREFLQARERQRAADAHREDGSVVVREERADAELPANAVRIRVIDAEGRGVADIPVGLIDLIAVPLPFFEMVRSWSSSQGELDDEPPTEDEAWIVRNGLARKEADVVIQSDDYVEVANTSFHVDPLVKAETGEILGAKVVSAKDLIRDLQSIKPKSVFFADAFLWRGVTDAEGEAIATWDRELFPVVEATFAFPWRANGLQMVRAEDSNSPQDVTLVLPEIHRTRVVGVHDLAVCADAIWQAHLIARGTGKDGGPIWISWDPFLSLSGEQDQAREWIWERGLDVEVEAYLDAPFAPVITEDRLVASESSDAVTTLRSSSHYAGARGELRLANGAIASHIKVQWRQTEWPEAGVAQFTYAQTSLDAEGRFQLVQAASPAVMRARELQARLQGESVFYLIESPGVERKARQSEGVLVLVPEQQQSETHFDTSILDTPGSVRDLGLHSFGDGPQLFAGVVRWTGGGAIGNAMVLLPRE